MYSFADSGYADLFSYAPRLVAYAIPPDSAPIHGVDNAANYNDVIVLLSEMS